MKNPKDQVLILTGGAGFIGSGVLKVLNDEGISNILVVDELGHDEKWKNLVGKKFDQLIHKDHLFEWLKGREQEIAGIIHLGACSSTVETDASYLLENNTHYSRKLAEYALAHQIRFIYASSAATYGDGSQGFSDDHELLESLRPLNMYGYSKHLFDLWLYREKVLDQVTGLKYFNVFGPNEYHKGRMSSALLKMVPAALKTGKISLFKSNDPKYGDGEQVRDFIYVKDAARITVNLLKTGQMGIYNVGSGRGETWNALAQATKIALQKPIQIEYIDMPDDLKGKYQNYTCAPITKSNKSPTFSLIEGVGDYVQNYLLAGRYW